MKITIAFFFVAVVTVCQAHKAEDAYREILVKVVEDVEYAKRHPEWLTLPANKKTVDRDALRFNVQCPVSHAERGYVYLVAPDEDVPIRSTLGVRFVERARNGSFVMEAIPGTKAAYMMYRQDGDPQFAENTADLMSVHKFGDFNSYNVGLYKHLRGDPWVAHLRDLMEAGTQRK